MKTYIWTLPIRISHWLLAIGLVLAYILGEEDDFLKLHVAFGYFVGVLLTYRFIYGITGSKYARFRNFPIGINSIREYFLNMNERKNKHIGHNPVSSVVMLMIFLDTFLVVATGILSLTAKGQGFLKDTITGIRGNEIYAEMHEVFIAILIGLVVLHLVGLIVDRISNKKAGTIQSIFTGYKNVNGENSKENKLQNIFLVIVLAFAGYIFSSTLNSDIVNSEETENQLQKEEDED
jgi:cytochrome b